MDHQTWTPDRILKTSGNYWATCALHGAVALDLFTRVGDSRVDGQTVAGQLNAPVDAVIRILDAVTAMGLLTKDAAGYANTEVSRTYLCVDSDRYIGYIIRHHHHLVGSWARLPEAVLTGKPIRLPVQEREMEEREAFLMGMFNLAMQLAPRLVPVVDLSGRRKLLDLGGGPGTYAIHFCRHYPNLTATVMDLPTTRPFAEKTIRKMGMDERVSYIPGDYLEDDIPGSYDAVWMSHILHGESAAGCICIVEKAARCLNPGGVAVIHEFILDDTLDRPLFPALFSLNMLLGTEGGRAYSQGQLAGMLKTAGFVDIQRLDFEGPNSSGLIRGVKPA
ncbi:MAG: methyltransferase domain-containing protein [Desulfosarcina sp.]|nr:methyltransferase domain-containing protein [Desulfosarcina sp.]MBC2742298.1 methyltransferase domain-containing protein [Desulfosarcina sp.]MBC2765209.1 methyltransferase domain-containing protein [Desulfosarcina sp.]